LLYPKLNLNAKPDRDDDEEEYQPPKAKLLKSEVMSNGKDIISKNGSDLTSSEKQPNPDPQDEEMEVDVKPLDETFVISEGDIRSTELKASPSPFTLKSNGEISKVTNGVKNGGAVWDSELEIDFIATEWLQLWLDVDNPPSPIDNSMLKCEHDKLAPPVSTVSMTACLYRIIPSCIVSQFNYSTFDHGTLFHGICFLWNLL
jgi:hypothetical protein